MAVEHVDQATSEKALCKEVGQRAARTQKASTVMLMDQVGVGLEEAHTTRLLISKIRKRQATFFGHVMRREKLENLVTTGMLEGKRSRGKQREKLIEGLTDWLKAGKSLEAIEATKDRKKWRTMIANAVKQGT
ncbi:hypothetical protein PoB_003424100 [Plakobranchus ocellatus]|uniref:Uncharacterized protein n=1 Tax=Plakobranchus ocellatus TaxID=259542 RepID=A0AAV4A957_9GAST|nr:hypothetical protein PoB_003424100 [Plakobranchus ocellatus]